MTTLHYLAEAASGATVACGLANAEIDARTALRRMVTCGECLAAIERAEEVLGVPQPEPETGTPGLWYVADGSQPPRQMEVQRVAGVAVYAVSAKRWYDHSSEEFGSHAWSMRMRLLAGVCSCRRRRVAMLSEDAGEDYADAFRCLSCGRSWAAADVRVPLSRARADAVPGATRAKSFVHRPGVGVVDEFKPPRRVAGLLGDGR